MASENSFSGANSNPDTGGGPKLSNWTRTRHKYTAIAKENDGLKIKVEAQEDEISALRILLEKAEKVNDSAGRSPSSHLRLPSHKPLYSQGLPPPLINA